MNVLTADMIGLSDEPCQMNVESVESLSNMPIEVMKTTTSVFYAI